MKFQIPNSKFQILGLIIIGLFWFFPVSAATLYSQSANQDTYEGQTFAMDWYLDTESRAINAINLVLKYSKDNLEIVEATAGDSLLNLWIKPPSADNGTGTISLTGGITGGMNSNKIPIFHTVFRAKAPGTAFINLDPTSQILLNDGSGTAITLKFRNETFDIYPKDFIPARISSATHPVSDQWYRERNVMISFEPKPGVEYSYSFSSNIEIIPENYAMSQSSNISYPNRPDGVYFFKLNSKADEGTWQEAGVYRVQIDATPPEAFNPEIGSDPGIFGGNKFVSFSTVDKTSGISHYKVKFGWLGRSKPTNSTYLQIPKFFLGNEIKITALDRAGNERTESIRYSGTLLPQWLIYIIVVIILALVGWQVWRAFKKYKKRENLDEK